VIILDEKIVFRMPKDARYRYELKNEIGLLAYLRKKIDIGIPEYKYIARDRTLAGYDIVPGKELTTAVFLGLTKREKRMVSRQLARFITVLHATPKSVLKKYHVRTDDLQKRSATYVREMKRVLYPRLSKKEIKAITLLLDELKDELDRKFPRTLVHRDLSDIHILWDERNKRINIIDFSDRLHGDPAVDFIGLHKYGTGFVRQVYRRYQGTKDDHLLTRARLYYRRMPLLLMMAALRGDPCTYRESYELFRRRNKI
jgi:aminoglycoside phosphotransferase (APT) family kinase protein